LISGIAHDHELLGMRHRKRAQHERVDQREDRRIGADAERQGKDRHACKYRGLGQRTESKAQIGDEVSHVLYTVLLRKGYVEKGRRVRTNSQALNYS
jgi:hypothetical protein